MPDLTPARKVAIGADHAGFELKEQLKGYIEQLGWTVVDCGTHEAQPADYPVIAYAVARKVADGECQRGVIIDGAGIGSAMAANKVPGVRAALCYDVSTAQNSREHNDANVLTLGSRLIGGGLAQQILEVWLTTECTEPRHQRRVGLIGEIERGQAPAAASAEQVKVSDEQRETSEPATTGFGPTMAMSAPASAPPPAGIPEQDVQRIVERVAAIITQEMGQPAGDVCTNLACMFCKVCAETDPAQFHRLVEMGVCRIGHQPGAGEVPAEVAGYIDHTLLRPDATAEQITKLCEEAKQYRFATVCVNPTYVRQANELLKGTPVKVCSVVGFPLGAHLPEIKASEARRAIRAGAQEIDMVVNVGALKSGDDELVLRDIRAVVEACREGRATCKVIIEAALLTDEEKVRACELARKARADYVKTSTGFGPGGATPHDVALMAETVRGTKMGVKAAGGIRTYAEAQKMIEAGATRIGASCGVAIVQESRKGVTVSP